MKSKKNARDKRADEAKMRRERLAGDRTASPVGAVKAPPVPRLSAEEEARRQEEETRAFLAYLEKETVVLKEETEIRKGAGRKTQIGVINLEAGMPTVDEAITRMKLGFQEMKVSGTKLVRVIHGYGSTGRGGKICVEVRKELGRLKTRKWIRGFVTGEEFGPWSAESRKMADQFPEIVRDKDYGRSNPGITIVML